MTQPSAMSLPAMSLPAMSLHDVTRIYGARRAVDSVSLELAPGRITCLLGPSGCGKSTMLRLIGGLEPVDEGEIRTPERLLSAPGMQVPPEQRNIGIVFQDYALFPHLNALDNVAFGLGNLPRQQREARALALLEKFRLGDRARAFPHMLSGGEQQRVAIARALACGPSALLLDEPFSGLDGALKADIRRLVLSVLREQNVAVLIVTHDPEEAMLIGDQLALMTSGRIVQSGTAEECYRRPASLAAARLLGQVNTLPAVIKNEQAQTPLGTYPAAGQPEGEAWLLVRPDELVVGPDGAEAQVADVRFGGSAWEATATVNDQPLTLRTRGFRPEPGGTVRLGLKPEDIKFVPMDASLPDPMV